MGPRVLIDTDVVIEYLGGTLPANGLAWLIEELNKGHHCISPVNQIELLGFNGPGAYIRSIEKFISSCEIIPIDDRIVAECILIRRQKKIKLPDALLAATAVVYNLEIISRNEKDFKGIKSVKVINLHKL